MNVKSFWEKYRRSGWLPFVFLVGFGQLPFLLTKWGLRLSAGQVLPKQFELVFSFGVLLAFVCVAAVVVLTLFACVYQFGQRMWLKGCLNALLVLLFGFLFIVVPILFVMHPPGVN